MPDRTCIVCSWRPATRLGRCATCYAYWRRTGEDRPQELLLAEGRAALEQEQAAAIWRSLRRHAEARLSD
jgi:hypothetical protein